MSEHNEHSCDKHCHSHHHGECHTHHHEECHCHTSCGCTHEHHEADKGSVALMILSALIFGLSFLADGILPLIITITAIAVCGHRIFISGIKSVIKLRFDESVLITIASVSAVILGEYHEGYLIILLFSIGEFLEVYAVEKSRDKINNLIDTSSDNAHNELGERIDAESIKIGDRFLVKPGDRVCVDAVVESGISSFDTSDITGESIPRDLSAGDVVLAGYINLNSSVVCKATTDYNNSTSAKIKRYVENASHNKANTEKFITRFAAIYTPCVIITAVIMGIIFALFDITDIGEAVKRSLAFMIASCPCALVISIPLSYFASIGTMSRYGLLAKGSKHINTMAEADAVVFDKTGTLTNGTLETGRIICSDDITEENALKIAKAVEIHSSHPVATAICNSYNGEHPSASDVKEYFGKGIEANVDGALITIGSASFCKSLGCYENNLTKEAGTILCIDKMPKAVITLSDELKDDAIETIDAIREMGIKNIYVLSGDNQSNVNEICRKLGIADGFGNLTPIEKAERIKEIKNTHKKVIFVGDGVNDAPALSEADFSVSSGSGNAIAIETGDAHLMSHNMKPLSRSIRKAKQTMSIIYSNIIISILSKLIVIVLAVAGITPIWLSVFADVGILMLTVINSMRLTLLK